MLGERERGEGRRQAGGRGCGAGFGAADRGEEAVEFFAVEGAELHVALDDAVEVGFLRFEVIEPAGRVSRRHRRRGGTWMYRVSPLLGSPYVSRMSSRTGLRRFHAPDAPRRLLGRAKSEGRMPAVAGGLVEEAGGVMSGIGGSSLGAPSQRWKEQAMLLVGEGSRYAR